jgi:hypothetical protein
MRYSNEFGFYELNPFPGCNQLVVSNHAFIKPEYRDRGHGGIQHRKRLQLIESLGYDAAICTVREDNVAEREILIKNGWTRVFSFRNSETDHMISVYMKGFGNNDFRYPVAQT